MISQGNGILLELGTTKYRFDPRRVLPEEVPMVSHAHSDHLPSSFRTNSVVCSAITRDFMKLRLGKAVEAVSEKHVEMIDAGHIAGSTMFLVRDEKSVLYTGDFCTRDKEQTVGAKPRKCDILIMEATYGKPRYVFPKHDEILAVARDWLEDIVAKGGSAILFAYPLGKSQELSAAFKDLPLVLHPKIAENNRLLAKHGYDLAVREFEGSRQKFPFVYITSGMGRDRLVVTALAKRGAKTAAFSGWALDGGFTRGSGVDEAFPVSDHCGFDELLRFAEKCRPELVLTTHGFTKELAVRIKKDLGVEAQPLIARQRTLDHFC